tara:strand:+ start:859 stop:1740 length:882 start_codon:yes stop_codon:yes gene_type:complete
MVLKLGSKGIDVKSLQEFLEIKADGIFGKGTEKSVKNFQSKNNLIVDGIVGPATIEFMGMVSTDNSELIYTTEDNLIINKHYLPKGEYKEGDIKPEYLFLHHTAGWNNPYKTIDSWGRDSRGQIATEFVVGGQSIRGNDNMYDGEVVQAFPEGNYGWHLGKNGNSTMHVNSVGIETNNFGYIVNGKTYAGQVVAEDQIIELDQPFRGYKIWHKYSEPQIESLRKLIIYIADRDSIDVRAGLPALVKQCGAKAFDFNEDAYYGKVKGLWTHTNTRKDKFDMSPQPELLEMLINL